MEREAIDNDRGAISLDFPYLLSSFLFPSHLFFLLFFRTSPEQPYYSMQTPTPQTAAKDPGGNRGPNHRLKG